ncbi:MULTISPECIES: arginase family protein [unclassified Cyanobium]|nr:MULTISPECIES: arginase family protein [unclassified Cyanobium]MCP9860698.1 hypothetical protein [Cyanobium sp. Cruz-8H5]MCP9867934.1 hypothetical protein [Cyanobium sp. Cruz-8D1]
MSLELFGVPYDGTTPFRPGARFGPQLDRDLEDLRVGRIARLENQTSSP